MFEVISLMIEYKFGALKNCQYFLLWIFSVADAEEELNYRGERGEEKPAFLPS